MTHCSERGSEMFVGDKSHIFLYEQGGAAYVSIQFNAGANPTIVSYNASVVKIYNATISLACSENNFFFHYEKNAPA
jgi:threonine aldolase